LTYLIYAILFIIAIVIYFVFFSTEKEPKATSEVKEKIQDDEIKKLLLLNIDIRKSSVDEDVKSIVETLIDDLRRITPAVLARQEGSEMAWVISRMSDKYLPELIKPFLLLSEEAQKNQKEKLIASIQNIDNEVKEVEAMLNSAENSDFESKARFIKHRFQ